MKYKQITVKVSHDEAELAACAMIEAGSEGVAVADGADVREVIESAHNWDYYDASLADAEIGSALVTGCFAEDFDISGLSGALGFYLGREPELFSAVCDSVDWENEWKKYYQPIDFGRLVVVPKWLDGAYGKPKILIDPGMAFGTGAHESTGMCIELLASLELANAETLDVGCGSGILGIAALALGAKECTFIDIDPQAVAATESNLALNGKRGTVICGDLAKAYKKTADVVLANLTADILLKLRRDLPCVTHSGSCIIMSGIINARAEDVLAGYLEDKKYELVSTVKKGEWQAFMMKRK